MPKNTILTALILLLFFALSTASAQIKGKEPPEYNSDTVFIFESPRPLISDNELGRQLKNAWGVDVLFSENGFGIGFFYEKYFSKDWAGIASLYLSGARNTDEFEYWDPYRGEYRVPNKINRLYMFPLMFGVQRTLLRGVISETFLPYLQGGAGAALIMATPYEREFFEAFGYADLYVRPGMFLGAGANINTSKSTMTAVNIRYYYIPFGGDGLESIKDIPIKNFGGVFLSLSIGMKF